jgi:hypothetical protein
LLANVLIVVFAFRNDLQRYADDRLPTARASHTGKSFERFATENFGFPGWCLGSGTDKHIPIKIQIKNPQTQKSGKYCGT